MEINDARLGLSIQEAGFSINGRKYLTIWLYFTFATSFVLTDSIKGTTPAFILAFASLAIPLIAYGPKAKIFLSRFVIAFSIYLGLNFISQLVLLMSPPLPSLANLNFISKDSGILFKTSLFTQSLYVVASFLFWIFVWTYYSSDIIKHLKLALAIFVLFGFYKWTFYILFGSTGDFISNRTFGEGELNPGQFQPVVIMGITLSRFVSLTGEPSVYVYSVLPYCIYFIYERSYLFALFLLSSLILAFSGTFIMGLVFWGISHILFSSQKLKAFGTLIVIAIILVLFLPTEIVDYLIYEAFLDKVNQNNLSGIERTTSFLNHFEFFLDSPFIVELTGLGFGVVRSADLFTMLLVNLGIVGFILFSILFFYPIIKLPKEDMGLKIGLVVIYFIMMISIPEYSYPALWLFLGMAYNRLGALNFFAR